MAQTDPKIQQLIEGLQKTLRIVGNTSKDQVQINRELLKVIALLESGLVRNEEDAKDLVNRVRKGLELTDETAAEWAKSRKIAKKDLDSILIKFRQIETLHGKINDKADEYNDALEDTEDSLDLQIDLSKKLFSSYKEINSAIIQSRKAVEKFGVGADEANKAMSQVINTTIAKKGILSSVFDDMFSSLEGAEGLIGKLQEDAQTMVNNLSGLSVDVPVNFDPKTGALDSEIANVREMIELEGKARLAGLVDFFNKNEDLQQNLSRKIAASMPGSDIKFDIDTGEIKQAGFALIQGSEQYEKALSQLDQIAIDRDALGVVSEMYMDIFELIGKGVNRTAQENKLLDQLNSNLDLGTQLLVRANIERQQDLDTLVSTIEVEKSRLKLMSKYSTTLQLAENAVTRIGYGFDYLNSILPAGIGDLLGLQKVSFTLIDAHRKGVQSFFEEIGKGSTKAEALSKYMKSFGPSLRLALTPTTLLIAGIALVYKFVSDITDKYKDMAQNMKVSLLQSKQLLDNQYDILTSQKNQFSTLEDIQAIQTAMIGSSGRISGALSDANKELILGLSETGKAFGYGSDQAVNLHKIFQNIGADDTLALNLQQNLGLMSEMAGLSPQIVAQDMVDASEEVYTYFAGMPEKAARAAIEVRKMGFSLKQAGSIAQKMLDLEGFMTDMYELQAMTGPGGIDFSRAFDKGLMGDIEGMTKEIMSEIGTTAELNRMDYMTRMKIAKTLGLSAEELSKSVMLHEKMGELGPEEAALLEGNLDRMGDISKLSKDQIKDRLKQLQSTDRLSVAWDKIKGIFVKSLLPLVEIFANVLESISPVIDLIIIPLKIFGALLRGILPVVNLLLIPFRLIGSVLEMITGGMDELPGKAQEALSPISNMVSPITSMNTGLGKFSDSLGTIGGLVKTIGATMAAWYIGKKIFPAMGSVKDMIGSTIKKIPVIGSLFGKVFGGVEEDSKDAAKTAQKSLDRLQVADLDVLHVNLPTVSLAPVEQQVIQKVQPAPDLTPKPLDQPVIQKVQPAPMVPVKPIEQQVLQSVKKNPETLSIAPLTQEVIQKPVASKTLTQAPVPEPVVSKKKKDKIETEIIPEKTESRTKAVFKGIQSIASKTFAGIAFDAARSFLPLGESGNAALDSVATHASSMFGGMDLFGGLFENLEYGVKKTVTKGLEEKISPMLDPITKKARKAFEKIGDKIPGKGLLSKLFGKQPEIDVAPLEQSQEIVQKTVQTMEPVKEMMPDPKKAVESVIPEKPTKPAPVEMPRMDLKPSAQVSKFQKFKDIIANVFTGLTDIIKSAWKALKSTLNEIVTFVGNTLKKISGAIGDSITKLLGGIAKGLNSFKTSALKGAAALLIVSGALWVTSKAVQNFASVKWEDIGKAIVSMGMLTGAALLLGSAAPAMLIGSAAMVVLGAALIPLAYGMKMFNDIEWESLGKAGAALVGFGIAAVGFGALSPMIIAGSVAIGILSASIALFGSSLMITSAALSNIVPNLESILGQIRTFSEISPMVLLGVATGITAIGASLIALSAMNLGTGIMDSISGLFSKGPIEKLQSLVTLADPLAVVADSISLLSMSLKSFSDVLGNLSLDNLDSLKEITKLDVGKLKPLEQELEIQTQTLPEVEFQPITPELQLNPNQQRRSMRPMPPSRESTAQDVTVRPFTPPEIDKEEESEKLRAQSVGFGGEGSTKNIERLLRELINAMHQYAQRPNEVHIGKSGVEQLHSAMKPFSNNIG